MSRFVKAKKSQAKLRLGLIGPSGSGKSYSALAIGTHLGERVAVIDTERGSASLYADKFSFDVLELHTFEPQEYVKAIEEAGAAGYDVLIIDSLSHAWFGKGGALEQVDIAAKRSKSANTHFAWREVTPHHNRLVDAMLQYPGHVIATIRAKTDYVIENIGGKQVPKKVGMAPIQRDGMEYEFTATADMDMDNNFVVSKTRCEALKRKVFHEPGADVAKLLKDWLDDGEPVVATSFTTGSAATSSAVEESAPPADHGGSSPVLQQGGMDDVIRKNVDSFLKRIEAYKNEFEARNHAKKHKEEVEAWPTWAQEIVRTAWKRKVETMKVVADISGKLNASLNGDGNGDAAA